MKFYIYKYILLCIVGMLFSSLCYAKFISNVTCEFYFYGDKTESNSVNSLLSEIKEGNAIQVCTSYNDKKKYYVFSKVSKYNKTFLYYSTPIFNAGVNGNYKWEYILPDGSSSTFKKQTFMARSEKEHLQQDNKKFIFVENISPGVFSLLISSWENILHSGRDAFIQATEKLSREEKESSDYLTLEKVIADNNLHEPIRIGSLFFRQGSYDIEPHYVVSIGNQEIFWKLEFDLNDGVIDVLSIVKYE